MSLYTIGTSGLVYIKQFLSVTQQAYIERKYMAYVGTEADLQDTLTLGNGVNIISPYSCFFKILEEAQQINIAYRLYVPNDRNNPDDIFPLEPNRWIPVGDDIDTGILCEYIRAAGGISNVQYAFQRGLLSDISVAVRIDGIPFFAKDVNRLYVYNTLHSGWILINGDSGGSGLSIGCMLYYHSVSHIPPPDYMFCNGQILLKSGYPQLYSIIGDLYTLSTDPDLDHLLQFRIPIASNLMIKVI